MVPEFVLFDRRGSLADEAESQGIRVTVVGFERAAPGARRLGRVKDLVLATRRFHQRARAVDIVEAWTVPAYTLAGLDGGLPRAPLLIAGRRSMPDVSRTRTQVREAARRLSTRFADVVVANSRAVADAWIAHDHLDPEKVRVIPNAVEPGRGNDRTRGDIRREWGIPDGALVIGCVANLRPGKGHSALLHAAATIRDRYPQVRWRLIGRGELQARLQQEIGRAGIEDIVTIDTSVSDARDVYCGLDLAVQASQSEGLPNAVLEAAAAGLPIVATDVGGTGEVIDSPDVGLLVPRDDAAALAGAIGALVDDEDLRARLGRAAVERSRSFSVARMAARTMALYLQLVERRYPGFGDASGASRLMEQSSEGPDG